MSATPETTAPETAAPETPPEARTHPTAPTGWAALRPLVLRLHFYAGVLVAPFLAIACLTGLIYVFSPQLSDAVYADELLVGPHAGPARPLDEQVAAALAAHPEGTLNSLVLPGDPDRTTGVVLDVDGLGDDLQRTVYVDPYTAQVRGSLDTWWDTPPLQTTLDALHRNLLLGEPGRIYSELAASWLWVLVLGGLALWIGKRRGRRSVRDTVVPPRGMRPGRMRIMGWHGATGVWLAVALLFISATGLTWSTYAGERFGAIVDAVKGSTPALAAESVPVGAGGFIPVQEAVDRAVATGAAGAAQGRDPGRAGVAVHGRGDRPRLAGAARRGRARPLHRCRHREHRLERLPRDGEADPHRHPRPHGEPVRAGQPARARRDGPRPALRAVLGLPHVVAAPPHPRRPPAHPAGAARDDARALAARVVRDRARRGRRRLAASRLRGQPAPVRRRRRDRGHPRTAARGGVTTRTRAVADVRRAGRRRLGSHGGVHSQRSRVGRRSGKVRDVA